MSGMKPPPRPVAPQSKSTPNLPTLHLRPIQTGEDATTRPTDHTVSPDLVTPASDAASIDDFYLDSSVEPPLLSPASSDEDSGGEEQASGNVSHLAPRHVVYHPQHSRSHTYLAPSAFAPPFYNRPPTPLPPSPSLTSLLRPSFGTISSRPTTPDPSSDEGGSTTRKRGPGSAHGTQTSLSAAAAASASALTSTLHSATPIPRASPTVPTYEYYGFTLYLTSSLAFIVYLLWSFLPSPFLHQLGIYYFPDRWWALAIPAWTVMSMLYIYIALASYNTGSLTLPMNSVECLVDEAANIAVLDAQGKIVRTERASWQVADDVLRGRGKKARVRPGGHSRQPSSTKVQINPELDWRELWSEGTDAVMDIPVGGVCEILYGGYDDEMGVNVDAG
ncbi:hypothetical protein B0A50_03417 [Salinomyces thailandicus]|uniref:PIG-P domain-containing protein n=1 Tax=Salinomyces thailandicus TaxID=706561 RepID=A0A4U0U4D8_9PEZI|nr:hypothetical protein B0A50_03417 [Salinomyces thailandica]